jgi:multiple sugar transport system permease protein
MAADARLGPKQTGRAGLTLSRREALACALFIAPAVFGFVAFALVPLLLSAALSFSDYAMGGRPRFVGLANYRALFADPLFWTSVRVTLFYAALVVPLWMLNSLALALLLNQPLRGVGIFRTIFYLPAMLSGVAVAVLWNWMYNYRAGLFNSTLRGLGLEGPNWLGDERWTMLALVLMSQWAIGYYLPIWLGGLQSIPTELYEAAALDGASWLQRLLSVTIPMLSPIILYSLIINMIWAVQLFTEPLILSSPSNPLGGPEHSMLSYVLYMYHTAFAYARLGQASAMAWMLFLVSLVLTVLVFRSSPYWVYAEAERRAR